MILTPTPNSDPDPHPSPSPLTSHPCQGLGYFEEGAAGTGKHKVLKIFRDMPDRCLTSLQVVYMKAGQLFTKLEALIERYRRVQY